MKSTPQGTRFEIVTDLDGNVEGVELFIPVVTTKTGPSKSGATVGHTDMIPATEVTFPINVEIGGQNLRKRFNLALSYNLWLKPLQVNLLRRVKDDEEEDERPIVQFAA